MIYERKSPLLLLKQHSLQKNTRWKEKFSSTNLDGIQFLAVVGEHVVGGGLGDVQDGFEGHLSLSSEVGLGQRQVTVLRDGLVKLIVFIISYIIASESEKKKSFFIKHQCFCVREIFLSKSKIFSM